MIGMIIFGIILILVFIGLYLLYIKGYIPYTEPHLERYKKKVDKIIVEIEQKVDNPDENLKKDVDFLNQKLIEIYKLFIFNSNLKKDTIERYYDLLSNYISLIINYHTADLDLEETCDKNPRLTIGQIRVPYPGHYNFLNNTFNVRNFFNMDNDLHNACYHITPEELEEQKLINCYNDIKSRFPSVNFCNHNNFYPGISS